MQRIIEKTLERNMPRDELYTKIYYDTCRVFSISGYKEAIIKKKVEIAKTKKEIEAQIRKEKKKKQVPIVEKTIDEEIEPEDPGHTVYELFRNSDVDFIPASIACVGKEDLCLCLFTTDVYYRKEKYGTQLMIALKNIYRGQKLHLYVRSSNKIAIDFYEKNGWVKTDIKPNFYWTTLNDEDALKMELQC